MRFGPPRGRTGLWLFAVEPTAAQLTWRRFPGGPLTICTVGPEGERLDVVDGADGPGALRIEGLRPASTYRLTASDSTGRSTSRTFTTLQQMPGEELSRFATLSDIHIGDTGFGIIRKQRAPELDHDFPEVCARAAVAEAIEWGAQAIVVKGDLTHSTATVDLERAASLFAEVPVPVIGVLGNHDVVRKGVDAVGVLRRCGVDITGEVRHLDLAGVRVVVLPTAHQGRHGPAVTDDHLDAMGSVLTEAGRPCWVGLHHYLQPLPFPLTYPPGLPSPDARRILGTIAAARPATMVSTGHSHRCRRHVRNGITVSEVGAPKDFPGVWAGYSVHSTGISQVVQRVADPRALSWNDRTSRAAGHLWGWYSPGTIAQRCFVVRWP